MVHTNNHKPTQDLWWATVHRLHGDLEAEGVPAADHSPSAAEVDKVRQIVSAEMQMRAWAEVLGVRYVEDLSGYEPSPEFVERVPIGFARQHAVMGLAGHGDNGHGRRLVVAVDSPDRWPLLDVIGRHMKRVISPILAPEEQILKTINMAYQQQTEQSSSLVEVLDEKETLDDLQTIAGREDLLDLSGRPPIIKLVNSILSEAVKARASDVHVQPLEESVVVRQRIDGVLFDVIEVPKDYQEEVISRMKVLGRMNIAEKRLPQDGRATVQFGDRLVDLRIASLPTSFGERVVIRFLDKSSRLYTLSELGMVAGAFDQFGQLIKRDHGILLVTGPTGSGKSTTLYAALQEINSTELNVLTLEDPIEYQLEGISQTQINQKKGLTFASGLRNVLRQDPDIIMVGEIRDQETAVMAIQSALTGHLVFSTLHTNDAASAVTRLLDLGIEPYLVSSSVIAVVAQRLVRKICPECKEPAKVDAAYLRRCNISRDSLLGEELFTGRGCDACRQTGYMGRVGIFELLTVTDAVRELVQTHANAAQIRTAAITGGMKLLRENGLEKAAAGLTTIEEVVRVTASDDRSSPNGQQQSL